MQTALDYLKKYFNHTSFRSPQELIIQTVLDKKDCIALLPTGGGKSVCFQIPALINKGICLVISPLIALMKDQVISLNNKGIKAHYLHAKLNQEDIIRIFDNCKYGAVKFLYLSPEKLQSPIIQSKLKELNINLVAIDEAHCVSEWGHDFRPSYLKISILKELLPKVPFLALTATATSMVLKDIQNHLELKEAKLFKKSFYRPNISYQIINTEDKNSKLIALLKKHKSSCIIYVNTRRLTKELTQLINKQNLKSSAYNGGMSLEEKEKSYANWIQERTPIMVATNAFGMGIDKANVQLIIHYNIPNSIENYMQETGRAGRNNKASYAYLLYNNSDINYLETQNKNNTPTSQYVGVVYKNLCQFYQIPYGELNSEWLDFDLNSFCKTYALDFIITYNALKTLDREGVLTFNASFSQQSTIQFIASNNQVLAYADKNKSLGALIKVILRNYGGLFDNKSAINLSLLSAKLNRPKKDILKDLNTLNNDKIAEFNGVYSTAQIQFLQPREDAKTVNKIAQNIDNYTQHKLEKLSAIIHFVKNTSKCRNKQLISYFGDSFPKKCGSCDVCLNEKKSREKVDYTTIAKAILNQLQTDKQLNSKTLTSKLDFNEKHVLFTLQLLLDNGKIIVNSQHQFTLK